MKNITKLTQLLKIHTNHEGVRVTVIMLRSITASSLW